MITLNLTSDHKSLFSSLQPCMHRPSASALQFQHFQAHQPLRYTIYLTLESESTNPKKMKTQQNMQENGGNIK